MLFFSAAYTFVMCQYKLLTYLLTENGCDHSRESGTEKRRIAFVEAANSRYSSEVT